MLTWFGISGSVASWLALIYILYTVFWGSPELRDIRGHIQRTDSNILKLTQLLEEQLGRMDRYISELIRKL